MWKLLIAHSPMLMMIWGGTLAVYGLVVVRAYRLKARSTPLNSVLSGYHQAFFPEVLLTGGMFSVYGGLYWLTLLFTHRVSNASLAMGWIGGAGIGVLYAGSVRKWSSGATSNGLGMTMGWGIGGMLGAIFGDYGGAVLGGMVGGMLGGVVGTEGIPMKQASPTEHTSLWLGLGGGFIGGMVGGCLGGLLGAMFEQFQVGIWIGRGIRGSGLESMIGVHSCGLDSW